MTGPGTVKRLEAHGIYTMGDLARFSIHGEDRLYKIFGVDAEILIDHAWGYEPCGMAEIKSYKPSTNSISEGQVLTCPYPNNKAKLIVREMAEILMFRLTEKKLVTESITLEAGYDRENVDKGGYRGLTQTDRYGRIIPKAAHGTVRFDAPTNLGSTMFPLSKDGSMLGMTAHERLIIRMELEDGTIICDTLRPKDIVIDSSLAGFHNTGVRNFTLAHEIGHQLLHIYYPLLALSDQLEEDCADIIAEGLLLPECLVRASMAFFQFPDTLSHISRSQLDMNYPSFKKMARQLGVQRQLLANRMKYLHILTSDVPYRHTLSLMEAG